MMKGGMVEMGLGYNRELKRVDTQGGVKREVALMA